MFLFNMHLVKDEGQSKDIHLMWVPIGNHKDRKLGVYDQTRGKRQLHSV